MNIVNVRGLCKYYDILLELLVKNIETIIQRAFRNKHELGYYVLVKKAR